MGAVFQEWTGLTLLDPWFLLLALLVPLALWLGRRHGAPAVRFAPGMLLRSRDGERLPRSWRSVLVPLPLILAALGLLALVVALARPAERERLPLEREGIDIMLCLDTSSSMTADDMDRRRTRLDVARDAATAFIRGRPEDRIGLISFARYPDLRCPLTLDHDALTEILAEVATVHSDGPEDATGIGAAVARAAEVLQGGAERSQVVILLTDGDENVALAGKSNEIPPAHAAQLCRQLDVRVYAVVAGVGRRDPSGALVKLDTKPIERLASRTGGTFHRARDAGAVAAVYERIDQLEKAAFEEPRFGIEDRFLLFLLAGIVLLLLARLLGATVLEVLP